MKYTLNGSYRENDIWLLTDVRYYCNELYLFKNLFIVTVDLSKSGIYLENLMKTNKFYEPFFEIN